MTDRELLSGNEAVALSAFHHGFFLATGYPGTPSTEILEYLSVISSASSNSVRAQWAPNEKVALEVGIGAAFAGARALVTMKHVGVNVAADALFSGAYTAIPGALVLVSGDDPGMASSQNEQDNRRYAIASAIPVLEPADSQQAYDFLGLAVEIAERWQVPVMLRMTTRVCHGKSAVVSTAERPTPSRPTYQRDFAGRVMLPANARRAHRVLREKLAEIAVFAADPRITQHEPGQATLGVICSGVTSNYVREVAPDVSLLVLGMCHPPPNDAIRQFVASVSRCIVIDEGDPILLEATRCLGLVVDTIDEQYRFGEMNVERVREILTGEAVPEAQGPKGRPPELCRGCSHRSVFAILAKHELIVSGDIGCYTLAALPPFSAIDSVVCMGASIGIGLGMRHVLSDAEGHRVVSVIGDSTFVHSGITGLVEMVYNPPPSGHVVIVLDNETTAMTGQQEHPATGRNLSHARTARLSIEGIARAVGVAWVEVIDPCAEEAHFEKTLLSMLESRRTAVIVARRPCLLARKQLRTESRPRAEAAVPASQQWFEAD